MNNIWKEIILQQFGAAIDALENSINACPEDIWFNRDKRYEYWYVVYHTLFWLDLYLTENPEDFTPPSPFGLEELDPNGVIPERPYTKDELLTYIEYCRHKCRRTINSLTEEKARQPYKLGNADLNFGEILLYNMRHVQHGAAQLNLTLRQTIDSAPGWSFTSKTRLRD